MMKEIKAQEELKKVLDFYGEDILSANTSFVEKDSEAKGFSSVDLIPVIQLHSDTRNIKDLFYVAYGKAIEKAKFAKTNKIFIMCNNSDLSEQLKEREGFEILDFTILVKRL